MKKTPLQIVKDKYESKEALVKTLSGKLERKEGESKGDFSERLKKVSCAKLLRLADQLEKVDKLGGKNAIVDTIHDHYRKGKEDKDFKTGLNSWTTGRLLDNHVAIVKKTRKSK